VHDCVSVVASAACVRVHEDLTVSELVRRVLIFQRKIMLLLGSVCNLPDCISVDDSHNTYCSEKLKSVTNVLTLPVLLCVLEQL